MSLIDMAIIYPDDEVLVARGRYSTLGAERREQIERVMGTKGIINTMRAHLLLLCNGIQERPTEHKQHLTAMRACLGNLENAWNRIDELLEEMEPLKALAWDGKDES